MSSNSVRFQSELAWPWSHAPWVLLLVALLLAGLTVWTYRGVPGAGARRMLLVLSLRLLALLLACLMLVRPSLAVRERSFLPGQLLLVMDRSRSMTIQDEIGGKSRWDAMQDYLNGNRQHLDDLEEQNVTIARYQFAEDARPFNPDAKPSGPRTDIGQTLQSLYQSHRASGNLLALVLVSDGADNGTRFPALAEAARWRTLPCKIYTIGLGKPTTFERQKDLAFTAINVDPSPLPIKTKMTVRGMLDAAGFENARVTVRLFIDGKEVLHQEETLRNRAANEIVMVTDAPSKPGEIKVTLKVDELPGETTVTNNEISTFVTATKEGISVLLVDRASLESQAIRLALRNDPRIRLYQSWRYNDRPGAGGDLFQFEQRPYDVIIIGDVKASEFAAGDPSVFDKIRDMVSNKGVGLMMHGGLDSFGNSDWANTPIAKMLPVKFDVEGEIKDPVRIALTKKGLDSFVMRLKEVPAQNKELWGRLNDVVGLQGMTKLGEPVPNATVLAEREGTHETILATRPFGEGRTLAFAGWTTWRWQRFDGKSRALIDAQSRFWRQIVLFLAKQDEVDGSVWIKPDTRRLSAGGKLSFGVGLRGKGGVDLKEATFQLKVFDPEGKDFTVDTARDADGVRGSFWQTEKPGEYRLETTGKGKDLDGKEVSGTASARFLVYQDEAEMMRRAADHDALDKLARAGGGKFYLAQDMAQFFKELRQQSLARGSLRTEHWPDWDRKGELTARHLSGSPFLFSYFLAFVGLLCCEWFLRRRWGLV